MGFPEREALCSERCGDEGKRREQWRRRIEARFTCVGSRERARKARGQGYMRERVLGGKTWAPQTLPQS